MTKCDSARYDPRQYPMKTYSDSELLNIGITLVAIARLS
jgi:hypothetical protein